MKKYYVLDSNPFDFRHIMRIDIPENVNIDKRAVYFGDTRYINDEEEYITLVKKNEELPDIYNYDLPLISLRMKEILDDFKVENIFYKPVILIGQHDKSYFQYYVPIIKPIDCVKWEKSSYKDNGEGRPKDITGGFVIDENMAGNFKIFKIKDVLNEFFVIEEELKQAFEETGIAGAVIVETESWEE